MSFIKEERPDVKSLISLFVFIDKLSSMYTIDQAIDVLDAYFKSGDQNLLPPQNGIRETIVKSNIKDFCLPIYENYNHLYDYVNDMVPTQSLKK